MSSDANVVGLGYSATALRNESTAIIDNPASLAYLDFMEFSFSQNFLHDDLSLSTFKFGFPLRNHVFGIRLSYFQLPDFKEIIFTSPGNSTLSFNEYLTTLSYGVNVNNIFSPGVNIHYYSSTLGKEDSSTLAMDIGAIMPLCLPDFTGEKRDNTSFGIALKNIGAKMKYRTEEEEIDMIYKGGVSYSMIREINFLYSLDYEKEFFRNSMGLEYSFPRYLVLRGGTSFYNRTYALTMGTTLEYKVESILFGVNYAYVYHNLTDPNHTISLSLKTIPYHKLVSMEMEKIKKDYALNIAVLDFVNENNNSEHDYFTSTIPESIGTYLLKEKRINLYTRKKIESILKDKKIDPAKIEDTKELKSITELLGTDIIIIGSFRVRSDKVYIKNIQYDKNTDKISLSKKYNSNINIRIFNTLDKISKDNLETIQESISK